MVAARFLAGFYTWLVRRGASTESGRRRPRFGPRLAAAYAVSLGLLILGLGLPLVLIESSRAELYWFIGAGSITALFMGLGFIELVARRVFRPLEQMTEAASAIAGGDLQQRLPEGAIAELADLGASLNHMASELSTRLETAAEERLTREVILAAMTEGVALVTREGTIQYLNPAAERLLGMQGAGGSVVMPVVLRLVEDAISRGEAAEDQFEIGHRQRVVRASALPVEPEGRALLVVRDVTQAARVDSIRKDFAAAASHELKTPVASIRAAAETLSETLGHDAEASSRFAAQILTDTERLSRIVTDLLDLSRLETEQASLEQVRLDLLAASEAERLAGPASAKGLALEVDAREPVGLRGSPKDLALAIRNLLDNAVAYTRPGGRVNLMVAARDGMAVIEVADTGIGVPSKDLPRIFERFYRVDRARSRETGGTGLGLALVKHVAEQHGGNVEAESELGRGSKFRLILPLEGEAL